ncbi:unnamed protein product [Gordionus sp. m RMFG-2023]
MSLFQKVREDRYLNDHLKNLVELILNEHAYYVRHLQKGIISSDKNFRYFMHERVEVKLCLELNKTDIINAFKKILFMILRKNDNEI